MKRPIIGFHQDDEPAWVADLSCGHRQHVRHDPPLRYCEWVTSEAGRARHVGTALDCPHCDRHEMPEGWGPYRRTKTFTERTVPAALRARHTTKPGVWGMIHVEEGMLRYVVHGTAPFEQVLQPGTAGMIAPEVEHEVHPEGAVRFFVELWRRGSTLAG